LANVRLTAIHFFLRANLHNFLHATKAGFIRFSMSLYNSNGLTQIITTGNCSRNKYTNLVVSPLTVLFR